MVPTLSTEAAGIHTEEQRQVLLGLAVASIESGLEHNRPLRIAPADCPDWLAEQRATFVTLKTAGMLRGCIGTLHVHTSLCEDVTSNAWAAASRDPRFRPVTATELSGLTVEISILGIPEKISFDSEHDLARQLRPGIDGLILTDRAATGTFLPAVWESCPEPGSFLQHLKLKAGLDADYWSDTIEASRYTTESFGADLKDIERYQCLSASAWKG
jgi:AmmeMemoRadiSam system protein A